MNRLKRPMARSEACRTLPPNYIEYIEFSLRSPPNHNHSRSASGSGRPNARSRFESTLGLRRLSSLAASISPSLMGAPSERTSPPNGGIGPSSGSCGRAPPPPLGGSGAGSICCRAASAAAALPARPSLEPPGPPPPPPSAPRLSNAAAAALWPNIRSSTCRPLGCLPPASVPELSRDATA
ncbi:hypothetical protein TSOC_008043 [Tetrabaena socialis]|uniref:Uncharacterized protein n=1 Tax=Tetrabaena socialis TaxID=47790 RepID=A0A2J7ZZG8_9CHLO|nr:hypothetical protein TSOC_008043 [Tetrabaena socialis]|eukprot:PNH05669.1 hypothetical protein TSOC_008043 [Tetrabaena socialis]